MANHFMWSSIVLQNQIEISILNTHVKCALYIMLYRPILNNACPVCSIHHAVSTNTQQCMSSVLYTSCCIDQYSTMHVKCALYIMLYRPILNNACPVCSIHHAVSTNTQQCMSSVLYTSCCIDQYSTMHVQCALYIMLYRPILNNACPVCSIHHAVSTNTQQRMSSVLYR